MTADSPHVPPYFDCLLDVLNCVCLDIQESVSFRLNCESFFLTPRVDPNGDLLGLTTRGLDVQANTEDPPLPEWCCLTTLDPTSSSISRCWH